MLVTSQPKLPGHTRENTAEFVKSRTPEKVKYYLSQNVAQVSFGTGLLNFTKLSHVFPAVSGSSWAVTKPKNKWLASKCSIDRWRSFYTGLYA